MKCKIDGCERECMYKKDQLCQKHYFRFMRYGTFDLTMKPRQKVRVHSAGYICLFIPDHPLANSTGEVYEHRKVVYDKYGDSLPDCELCGKKCDWSPYTTHIDHINKIKSDNDIKNLRVLCNACNSQRDLCVLDRVGVLKITIDGVTKTAYGWAQTDGANHSGSSISRRFKNGMSGYDAVFGKNKTHPRENN
jgi:hypothetical protein